MNIKKAIVLPALIAISTGVFAQAGNVRKAATSLQEFEKVRDAGSPQLGEAYLKTAKENIDGAIEHEKTKDKADTWLYYALIYANSAFTNENDEDEKKAVEGIIKTEELDTEKKNEQNLAIAKQLVYNFNYNKGAKAWQAQDSKKAFDAFSAGLRFFPNDTTLTYYSGIAATQAGDLNAAIEKYLQLIDRKDFSSHKTLVSDIPKIYLQLKDTENALKYADLATKAYPEDKDLAIYNIELNLNYGDKEKVVSDIKNQIEKDPTNKNLYFYLGIAESTNGNLENSFAAYNKALEIDPSYGDANLNAGVILWDIARNELNAINNDASIKGDARRQKYDEIKAKLKPIVGYFNKALEADPTAVSALKGLKMYYDFTEDEANAKLIQERIDAL